MHTGLLHTHSMLRWAFVIVAAILLVKLVLGARQGGAYPRGLVGAFLGILHINVLVGLGLWLGTSPVASAFFADVGAAMKQAPLRFYGLEHPLMMIVAAIVATIGSVKAKRAPDNARRLRTALVFQGVAILVVLAAIPWPFRGEAGRALLPF